MEIGPRSSAAALTIESRVARIPRGGISASVESTRRFSCIASAYEHYSPWLPIAEIFGFGENVAVVSDASDTKKRLLEPSDRVAEVLFGLIMVLTFTGSLSAAEADRSEVRTMLIGALGCNFAWGVIDAFFYLLGCLGERGEGIRALRAAQDASNPENAHRVIADALPRVLVATLDDSDVESMRKKLLTAPPPPSHPRLQWYEWRAAIGVFLWVFITTFPVAVPFLLMADVARAMRVSNAIAVTMLFLAGYAFGRIAGFRPWATGLSMIAVGTMLVVFTIALGG